MAICKENSVKNKTNSNRSKGMKNNKICKIKIFKNNKMMKNRRKYVKLPSSTEIY
jgi:hypothetical protein